MEHIVASQAEEIIITDVFENNDDQVREINAEFVQDSTFKGIKRTFTLYNRSQIRQMLQSFKHKQSAPYRINLRFVRLEPERNRQYAWRCLLAFGIGLLLSMLPVAIWYYTEFKSDYLLVASLLFCVTAVIALLLFFYRTRDTWVYKSLVAGVPLIELDNRKPNLHEFDAFMSKLEIHIRDAHMSDKNQRELLAGELKDLRRLKEAGMLSEATYEQARATIFRHKDYSVG
jgi:heme/copper-type cytochrome/quinol oxidase subunit 4